MRFVLPFLACSALVASTITVSTPDNSFLNGLPVDATATFEVQDGHVTVTVENLISNPRSAAQNLSEIAFVFGSASNPGSNLSAGALLSGAGSERTVKNDGTYIDGSLVSSGWQLVAGYQFSDMTGILIELLDTQTAPTHTIIGSPGAGGYTNANASLKRNHNPFLAGPVVFSVAIAGLRADSPLKGVEFAFNTAHGYVVDVVPSPTPEPGSFGVVGLVAAFGLLRLHRSRRRR